LRDLAVCMKIKIFYFFCVLPKTRYFNIEFVSLQYKNTNRCWLKYNRKFFKNHRFLKYYIYIFGPSLTHVARLDLANLRSWAGPRQPSLVTGPCQWLASLPHARLILYSCMNSAKVIKLPSHCSSSWLQYKNRTKRKKPQSDCGFGFLTFCFLLLHTKHASSRTGTEKDIERTWFWEDEDDGGAVLSTSPCPLLSFGLIPLLSLLLSQYFSAPSYFLCFPLGCFTSSFFLLSVASSLCTPPSFLAFGSSSGFYS